MQPIAIENGTVTAHFGDKEYANTFYITSCDDRYTSAMAAPYTADFISAKKAISTVIQANWDLLQSLAGVEVMVNFLFLQKVSVGLRFRKELLKLDLVQLEIEMEK